MSSATCNKNKLEKRNMRKNLHSLLAQERIRGGGEGYIIIIVLNYQGQQHSRQHKKTLSNREKFAAKWLRKECFAKENVKRFSCYLGRERGRARLPGIPDTNTIRSGGAETNQVVA